MSSYDGNLRRAIAKLRETVYNTPFSPNTNDAHINALRADVDFVIQAADEAGVPKPEQRSNGSADKDEPIEHTEAYKNRSNDWLGFAEGGQLTRTENADEAKLSKLRSAERRDEEAGERIGQAARDGKADDVSTGADRRNVSTK